MIFFYSFIGCILQLVNKTHAIKVDAVIQNSKITNEKFDTIVFSQNEIVDIGRKRDLEKDYSFDAFEEIEGAIIVPGLINTHTHSIQTFFRGLAENLQLLDWLNKVILPGEAALTKDEVYASSLLGYIDMISHGTTFANDMVTTHYTESAIQAAFDTGIRVKTGKLLMDIGPENLVDDTNVAIEESYRLIEKYHNKNPLMEYSINPRFLVSCTGQLMKECSKIMLENPTLSFHTHASENKSEIEAVKKLHGDYIRALFDYGNLGNRSILAHGIWLSPKDIAILHSTKTAVSHCPSSNSKLASGICDWPKLLENDIPTGLGTDGPPSNYSMYMFSEMRIATIFQRISSLDETRAPSKQVFNLATIYGAQALRRSDLGTLEKGKKADFLILDISHPSNYPIHNFINHLVYKSTGKDVLRTYIDGKKVYDSKQEVYEKMFPLIPTSRVSKALKISKGFVENKKRQQY